MRYKGINSSSFWGDQNVGRSSSWQGATPSSLTLWLMLLSGPWWGFPPFCSFLRGVFPRFSQVLCFFCLFCFTVFSFGFVLWMKGSISLSSELPPCFWSGWALSPLQNHPSHSLCCQFVLSTGSWTPPAAPRAVAPSGNLHQDSLGPPEFSWRSVPWCDLCHLLWPEHITASGVTTAATPGPCFCFSYRKKNTWLLFFHTNLSKHHIFITSEIIIGKYLILLPRFNKDSLGRICCLIFQYFWDIFVSPWVLRQAQDLCLCKVMACFILVPTRWETQDFKACLEVVLTVLAS